MALRREAIVANTGEAQQAVTASGSGSARADGFSLPSDGMPMLEADAKQSKDRAAAYCKELGDIKQLAARDRELKVRKDKREQRVKRGCALPRLEWRWKRITACTQR